MRYTVVYLDGSLNESGVSFYMVVDANPGASVGVVVARGRDADHAVAIAAALNLAEG